jgi:hypothetical protein
VISAIVSTAFSIIGTVASAIILSKTGTLQYEVSPVSYFKNDSAQLVNVKILNNGTKECEDVILTVDFGSNIIANDFYIQKSSQSIIVNKNAHTENGKIIYSIPYLNPRDELVYSFLFKNKILDTRNFHVDLRSKGVNAVKEELPDELFLSFLIVATFALYIFATIFLIIIIFHQKKLIKLNIQQEKLMKNEILNLQKQIEKKPIAKTVWQQYYHL